MEILTSIFKKLYLELDFDEPNQEGQKTDLLYINNPDGTVRWIWPARLNQPLFLKFYAQDSFRAQIIAFLLRFVFFIGIHKRVFRKVTCYLKPEKGYTFLGFLNYHWALFTGTSGPNRKAIFYVTSEKRKSFIKIGLSRTSEYLIETEARMLNRLAKKNIQSFNFPKIKTQKKTYIETTDISNNLKRSQKLSGLHIQAIGELNSFSSLSLPLHCLPAWNRAKEILVQRSNLKDPRIPNGLITKLKKLIQTMDVQQKIECGYMHGDFTPWNMFEGKEKLNIYDWELNHQLMPIGYDLYHFISQKGILIEKLNWQEIEAKIKKQITLETLQFLSPKIESNFEVYLKLYLLFNITYYLDVFSRQRSWHKQVTGLLKTWSQSVSSALRQNESHRSLLILDVFDFLNQETYAALKFPEIPPDELSEYSDIDLCLEKPLAIELTRYIKCHPLVKSCKVIRKSFMYTMKIICHDGNWLSLDLIWQLKRKALVLSDLKSLLQSARTNAYQVKVPSDIELARFVLLFYNSNRSPLPEKYLKFLSVVRMSNESIDQALTEAFINNDISNSGLLKIIRKNYNNKGFSKLKNIVEYLADTVKGIIGNPGMVITFSGVDGAGKSTVIEEVKKNLENIYRTRVVVLRHRPSLLPILSAWTKGKIKAEQEASQNLPGQGTNSSLLSSILRYLYYYFDYLFGQFVVYYRHVLRGHIVLYDRYYFDFISDSKRSNIQLPSGVAKLGYYLLIKPNQNFFLYANPEVILSRKKELDKQRIQELTNNYKKLFKNLNQKNNKQRYRTIENINLNTTIELILTTLNQKVA